MPGGNAVFSCYSPSGGIDSISWLVNGSTLETLDLGEDVTAEFNRKFGIGKLNLTNLTLSYNTSRIQCIAKFRSGATLTSSGVDLLLLATR